MKKALVALALLAMTARLATAQDPPTAPGGPPRVLLDAGALRTWDGASTDLAPLPKWVTVRLGAPYATLSLRDGRLVLVLGKAESEPDKKKNKHDGAALLLGWPGGGTADLGFRSQFLVTFEGMPLLAAGTDERAWVYARAVGATDLKARAWIYDIDFHGGRVADSTFLPGSVRGLAVEPGGGRLFAGIDDRVLSLTTSPLVTSWHYRSPGPNGPLAIAPDGRVLAAVRGAAVALFDAREIAARTPTERRERADDATRVVTLDRPPRGLAFSDDGGLLAIFGSDRVVYVDPRSGPRLGEEKVAGQDAAEEIRPLVFPGGGGNLVVAALPSGAVAALPSPETPAGAPAMPVTAKAPSPTPSAPPPSPSSDTAAPLLSTATTAHEPAANAAETAPPPAVAPTTAAPPSTSPASTGPRSETAQPPPTPATPASEPAAPGPESTAPPSEKPSSPAEPAAAAEAPAKPPTDPSTASPEPAAPPAGPPTLSGHIGGVAGLVKGIVLYGPSSIIREFRRTGVQSDGGWSMPLPPPGHYRVVPIGDGSTPIPVRPGFLSITVEADRALGGLDFTAGPAS